MPRLILLFIGLIILLSLAGYIIFRLVAASQQPSNQGTRHDIVPESNSDKIILFAAIAALIASLLLFFID